MVTVYVYMAECDQCGHIGGPFKDFGTALGKSNNHNSDKHGGQRKAYPVTETINT